MAAPIHPMPEYVVLEAQEARTKTASGIYLPESAAEKPKTAKVVAVGSAIDEVKVGDSVIYKNEFEATKVSVNKAEYIIVFRQNIIATTK